MIERIINEMAVWFESVGADEDMVCRTIRRVLPSWRITRERDYGIYDRRGWRRNYIQIYKGDETHLVPFWEYDTTQ